MSDIENARRYSIQVKPEANLDKQYTASICVKELVDGFPFPQECHSHIRPGELEPTLQRLGIEEEQIGSILARIGHDLAITVTADIDPDALKREGFQAV